MSDLPVGVHPKDMAIPIPTHTGDMVGLDSNAAAPLAEGPSTAQTARRLRFASDNGDALGVFERASHEWAPRIWILSSNDEPKQIVGRQVGRKDITLWVPATLPSGSPLGVMIGRYPEDCYNDNITGIVLNPGDSLTIETEAPVYAAVIPGNSLGNLYSITAFNPPK